MSQNFSQYLLALHFVFVHIGNWPTSDLCAFELQNLFTPNSHLINFVCTKSIRPFPLVPLTPLVLPVSLVHPIPHVPLVHPVLSLSIFPPCSPFLLILLVPRSPCSPFFPVPPVPLLRLLPLFPLFHLLPLRPPCYPLLPPFSLVTL